LRQASEALSRRTERTPQADVSAFLTELEKAN
jgi:hypothetical protein